MLSAAFGTKSNVSMYNGAKGGTTSSYMALCLHVSEAGNTSYNSHRNPLMCKLTRTTLSTTWTSCSSSIA